MDFNTDIQGQNHDVSLDIFDFDYAGNFYTCHIDYHNLVTDEKGRYEDFTIPAPPGQGQSRLPGLKGRLTSRMAQETPLPTTRF